MNTLFLDSRTWFLLNSSNIIKYKVRRNLQISLMKKLNINNKFNNDIEYWNYLDSLSLEEIVSLYISKYNIECFSDIIENHR